MTTSSLLPAQSEWNLMGSMAQSMIKSGFLPSSIRSVEQAVVVMLKGRELNVPPMQAFSHIHVIQGKPTISAEMMLSLIYKNVPGSVVNILETSDTICSLEAKRPGGKFTKFAFSLEDAKKAGLLGKDSWQKYPRAMLRSRVISEMARAVFPDALMGCSYVPEELGVDVTVTDTGEVVPVETAEVIDVQPELVKPQPTKPAPQPKPSMARAAARQSAPAAEKELTKTSAQGGSIYEGTEDQNAIVQRILQTRDVPKDRWKAVQDKLFGQPSMTIHRIIAEVMA